MTREELTEIIEELANHSDIFSPIIADKLIAAAAMLQSDGETIAALEAERDQLRAELALWQKAFGLLTTLHGSMQIDISDPLRMAKSIEVHVRAELAEYRRGAERYRTALEQIVAPFEDLNFVSGNKLLTYIHDTATSALAADGENNDGNA